MLSSFTVPSGFTIATTQALGERAVCKASCILASRVVWNGNIRTCIYGGERKAALWHSMDFGIIFVRGNDVHGIAVSELNGIVAHAKGKHGAIAKRET